MTCSKCRRRRRPCRRRLCILLCMAVLLFITGDYWGLLGIAVDGCVLLGISVYFFVYLIRYGSHLYCVPGAFQAGCTGHAISHPTPLRVTRQLPVRSRHPTHPGHQIAVVLPARRKSRWWPEPVPRSTENTHKSRALTNVPASDPEQASTNNRTRARQRPARRRGWWPLPMGGVGVHTARR